MTFPQFLLFLFCSQVRFSGSKFTKMRLQLGLCHPNGGAYSTPAVHTPSWFGRGGEGMGGREGKGRAEKGSEHPPLLFYSLTTE